MNPLIDLLTILIGKLGTTTEMFLVWLQLHNSKLRGLTFVATFSYVENLVSSTYGFPSLNIISTLNLFSIVTSWIIISVELVKPK